MDKRFFPLVCIAWLVAAAALFLLTQPQPACSYCHPTLCITSSGCIPPCVCAKQQGEAYGTCTGTSHEP
jgi:hypothetical protein